MKDIQFKILENSNCQKFASVIPTILVEKLSRIFIDFINMVVNWKKNSIQFTECHLQNNLIWQIKASICLAQLSSPINLTPKYLISDML